MELLKLLSASQLVAQIISFLILFIIMRAFLWKRFLGILDERKKRIEAELKKIDQTKADLAGLKTDYETRLGRIEETSRSRIEEAVAEGRRMAEAIREDAKSESRKIIDGAKETIKEELLKARDKLKDQIIDITINVAEKVIEEKLTVENDKKLVEDFLKGMGKGK